MKTITGKIEAIEALRRERMDPRLRVVPVEGIDYAGAGLLVQHALAALDEGIPNRQRMRVQTAIMALVEGTSDMVRWAWANGYFSDEASRKEVQELKVLRDEAIAMSNKNAEWASYLRDGILDVLNTQGLSDVQKDLLEKALAGPPKRTHDYEPPTPTEPPKGHIFAFMHQPRATQFVELLQREGVGSTLSYDSDNNQHHVAVAVQNNDKALEVYELLKKEMSSGA